jgi:RNA polymerase sigma-70 factor (ECF subfamily)
MFDECFDRIYAYVAFRVAPDREAARDITQEVFAAAWRSFSMLRSDGAAHWLMGIARHKIADHYRSKARLEITGENLASAQAALPTERRTPVLISLALRELPEEQRGLLEEKYLEGRSVNEIAQERSTTEKAVESALTRARSAFRSAYERLDKKEKES